MTVELKVPEVGESITEVQIGEWLVPKGGTAEKEAGLVVIETDKVTVELPAPVSGKLTRILKEAGATAAVGEVIGYMEEGSAAEKDGGAPAKGAAKEKPKRGKEGGDGAREEQPAAPAREREVHVMPAARRALHAAGLEAEQVEPSGPGGRLLKEDVLRRAEERSGAEPAAARGGTPARPDRREELVPLSPLRKRIAQRLVEAQKTAALLTTFNEVDMSAAKALRARHQESFQARYGVKLGFMSFFVKAVVDALKLVPRLNAEIREDAIAYRDYHDIGVAVGGGKGLVVPVLRDADRLSFAELELAISDFAKRAQENKLTLEELSGGTFTISNGGVYGSLLSTPIVNPPQSGILGLHAIQERAVVLDGQIVARPMMYVALTYDHRIVDGREAVTFLKRVKECVESPERMLLEI